MQYVQNSYRVLQHIVQVRILQIRQKRCTIRASKARASERKVKRKNTRAPCRIRREGITCRGVVPFAFRRRRDVLFFSFFLKKTRRGSGRLVFLFLQRKAPFPHLHIPAFSLLILTDISSLHFRGNTLQYKCINIKTKRRRDRFVYYHQTAGAEPHRDRTLDPCAAHCQEGKGRPVYYRSREGRFRAHPPDHRRL